VCVVCVYVSGCARVGVSVRVCVVCVAGDRYPLSLFAVGNCLVPLNLSDATLMQVRVVLEVNM